MRFSLLALLGLAAVMACVHAVGGTVPPPGANNGVAALSFTTTCDAGTCNGVPPTDTDGGMEMAGTQGVKLMVCAAAGQTLSGGGSIRLYRCSLAKGVCGHDKGLDVSVNLSGEQCQAFPDLQVGAVPWTDETLTLMPSNITVSAGTNITIYADPGGPK